MFFWKVDSGNLARTLGFVSIWKKEGTPSEPLSSLLSIQCPNLHLRAGAHLLVVLSCLCQFLMIRVISEPSLHQPERQCEWVPAFGPIPVKTQNTATF